MPSDTLTPDSFMAAQQAPTPAVPAPPKLTPDAFMRSTPQVAASDMLPSPQDADQQTTFNAKTFVEVATRPTPGVMDYLRLGGAAIGAANEGVSRIGNAPLVDVNAMLPRSLGPGAIRGAAEIGSELTSPANIGMLAFFPEGEMGKLLTLGFSAEMIVGASKQVPEFVDAVRKGDAGRARQAAVQIIVPTLMAALGTKHATRPEPVEPRVTPTMRRDALTPDIFMKEQANATPAAGQEPAAKPPAQSQPARSPERAERRLEGKPGPAAKPSPAPAPAPAPKALSEEQSAARRDYFRKLPVQGITPGDENAGPNQRIRQVPLADLEPTQPRVETFRKGGGRDVARYRELLRQGSEPPPLSGFFNEETGKVELSEGHRRLEALKAEGRTHAPVIVGGLGEPAPKPVYTGGQFDARKTFEQDTAAAPKAVGQPEFGANGEKINSRGLPVYEVPTSRLGPKDYLGGEEPETVAEHRRLLREGSTPPPIEGVMVPGGDINIVNGFHRLAAAKAEGQQRVRVFLANEDKLTPAERSSLAPERVRTENRTFTKDRRPSNEDYTLMEVPTDEIDSRWAEPAGRENLYIRRGGGGAEIGGRLPKAKAFIETGQPIEAPRVYMQEGGRVDFEDGRHRFAALRDAGDKTVAVMVPNEQVEQFRALGNTRVPQEAAAGRNREIQGISSTEVQPKGGAGNPPLQEQPQKPAGEEQKPIIAVRALEGWQERNVKLGDTLGPSRVFEKHKPTGAMLPGTSAFDARTSLDEAFQNAKEFPVQSGNGTPRYAVLSGEVQPEPGGRTVEAGEVVVKNSKVEGLYEFRDGNFYHVEGANPLNRPRHWSRQSEPSAQQSPAAQPEVAGRNREFFRGSWELNLNADGRRQVAEAGRRNAGQFDEIFSGTRQRHADTAQAYADTNPQAGPVQKKDVFNPMDLGGQEGHEVTPERLDALNDHIRNRPEQPLPGVGQFSGVPGEAPKAWANRLIGGVQDVVKKWKPGEKKLIVTSGRDVQAIRAWAAKGMPADRSTDPDVLTARWETQPGQMMRLDPRTGRTENLDQATGDGIYFARHGETAGNNNPEIPAEVQASEQGVQQTVQPGFLERLDQAGQEARERLRKRGIYSGGQASANAFRTGQPPAEAPVDAARTRLKSRLKELARGESGEQRFNLSTQDLEDLATVGAHYLRQFGAKVAEWSDAMRRDFGDRIAPYLDSVYRAAIGKRQLEVLKSSPAGIGVGELREEVPTPKREFDQALLHLYRQNQVELDAHDFPQGMSQTDQDHYTVADGRGNYYVMANAAPAPAEPPRGPVDPFSTMHGGIPLDVVGAIFKADIGEMSALWEKRRQALAELEKSKETPAEKNFGRKVISYFVGERDVWGARVNQVMARLRQLVPDPIEQEALFLMRDFKGREPEMLSFLDGSHPALMEPGVDYAKATELIEKLRPAIMKAFNPTPKMIQADAALTKVAGGTLKEGQRLQMLDSRWTAEQYAPHLLGRKGEGDFAQPMRGPFGRQLGGKIGKYFQFAQARDFPTALHAIAQGYRPRTLNAFDAFTIHGDKFATARATRLLEQQLVDTGVGHYAAHSRAPLGTVRLAPHSNEFRKLVPFLRQGPALGSAGAAAQVAQQKLAGMKAGLSYAQVSAQAAQAIAAGQGGQAVIPDVAELGLWVRPEVEKALRPITDPDYMERVPGFRWIRKTQSWQKAVQLGLSLFHATTENYMALSNMGPTGWAKALRVDRLDPDFEKAERDFIAHGGTTSIQGRTVEAYKALQPGSIPNWVDIWRKAPVIHQVDFIAGKLTDFTFGNLQRKFKVTDYQLHQAAWMADHPNATTADLIAAKASIAKEINAVYGGLHTELLGINRATAETARAIFLAPDWTFSNVFNVKYTFERGTAGSKLARAFWARQIVGGVAATQLLSLALSQKLSPNPTQVYMGKDKDGQDIYQNVFFKGASGDVVNFVHNVYDYGAVEGLARTMSAKSAGLVRMLTQLFTNRDYLGHEIVNRNLNPIAGTIRGAAKIAEAGAPIPFTVTNVKDMLVGPHAEDYTAPEFLTTFFGGTPPRHVPPEGFKMTPEGLEEKEPEAERNSLLDQIRTGKAFAGRQ